MDNSKSGEPEQRQNVGTPQFHDFPRLKSPMLDGQIRHLRPKADCQDNYDNYAGKSHNSNLPLMVGRWWYWKSWYRFAQ
jgi:hypothetical protein